MVEKFKETSTVQGQIILRAQIDQQPRRGHQRWASGDERVRGVRLYGNGKPTPSTARGSSRYR